MAPKLDVMFEYIYKIGMGDDFGYNCFIQEGESLLDITCLSDTEILQIKQVDFVQI